MARPAHDWYAAMRRDVFGQRLGHFDVEHDFRARLFCEHEAREENQVAVGPDGRARLVGEPHAVAVAVEGESDVTTVGFRLLARVLHHFGAVWIGGVVRIGGVHFGIAFDYLASRFAQ